MALPVKVTIDAQGKAVDAAKVKDASLRTALVKMGSDIGAKLARTTCKVHGRGPTEVRVHVGAGGSADLAYESCCEALREAVTRALG
jgi:hypothetical protein